MNSNKQKLNEDVLAQEEQLLDVLAIALAAIAREIYVTEKHKCNDSANKS